MWVSVNERAEATARAQDTPNYVTASSYPEMIPGRSNVGDVQGRRMVAILDVRNNRSVWADASAFAGVERKAKPADPDVPRLVNWTVPDVSDDGSQTVVAVRALDNKDRWLVKVDPATGKASERLSAWRPRREAYAESPCGFKEPQGQDLDLIDVDSADGDVELLVLVAPRTDPGGWHLGFLFLAIEVQLHLDEAVVTIDIFTLPFSMSFSSPVISMRWPRSGTSRGPRRRRANKRRGRSSARRRAAPRPRRA